jgi:hypothetical protein
MQRFYENSQETYSMAADNGDTLTPVSQWAYPFPQKSATGTVNPDAYLAALQGSDGPFPLGLNGLWHGGIHLDQTGRSPTAADSAMDRSGGVRCIADGVVVAYRLDSDYQHLSYPDKSTALYSRSFTLVKHKLTLPAAPTNTPNAPTSPNTPNNVPHPPSNPPAQPPTTTPANNEPNKLSTDPADSLVFFSLYMHLAPCSVYKRSEQDKNKKNWPSYYNAEPLYTVSDKRATDQQENVKAGEPVTGSHVHRDNHGHAGEKIGILPSGTKVKIQRPAHAPKNWGRISSIVSGDIVPVVPGKAVPQDASHGWVFLPWLDSEIDPEALDSIYLLPKPIRIGAGEVIGYLGEYQNVEHASTLPPSPQRALLHVEVFAGDDLQAFLARSQARAAQLTQEPKTQLVLSKGANLYTYKTDGDLTLPANTAVTLTDDAPHAGMWTKVQVKAAGAASATNYWIMRSEVASHDTRRAWNSFPLSLTAAPTGTSDFTRVVSIAGFTEHVDDKKQTWYEVDAGDATMNTVNGFVCASGQPNVSLQNKWAWAGFELLSSNLATADLYKRYLYLKGDNATADEKIAFEASFNAAKGDALIAKLDEILTPKSQEQGKVGGQDLLTALNLKWRADRVDHLVVKYESEWGGQMSKWDALDPFMHDGLPYWKTEKERIKLLQMWDACASALQPLSSPFVYHLHPVGIVGNFADSAGCMPLIDVQTIALAISTTFEGGVPMRYATVANNFDQQGMSYGLVQWNAGQNTLGPVLRAMQAADTQAFRDAFPSQTEYDHFNTALSSSSGGPLKAWAIAQQASNPDWMVPFQKLADVEAFKEIQVEWAARQTHEDLLKCLTLLRSLAPDLLERISVVNYCALFDLAIQQRSLDSAEEAIRQRLTAGGIETQSDLIKMAVVERAKTARSQYVSLCVSRRMGILTQQTYTSTENGVTVARANSQFKLLKDKLNRWVCGV